MILTKYQQPLKQGFSMEVIFMKYNYAKTFYKAALTTFREYYSNNAKKSLIVDRIDFLTRDCCLSALLRILEPTDNEINVEGDVDLYYIGGHTTIINIMNLLSNIGIDCTTDDMKTFRVHINDERHEEFKTNLIQDAKNKGFDIEKLVNSISLEDIWDGRIVTIYGMLLLAHHIIRLAIGGISRLMHTNIGSFYDAYRLVQADEYLERCDKAVSKAIGKWQYKR